MPAPARPYGRTLPSGLRKTRLAVPDCMFMSAEKSVGTAAAPGVGLTGTEMRLSPRPLKLYMPSMPSTGDTFTWAPILKL